MIWWARDQQVSLRAETEPAAWIAWARRGGRQKIRRLRRINWRKLEALVQDTFIPKFSAALHHENAMFRVLRRRRRAA